MGATPQSDTPPAPAGDAPAEEGRRSSLIGDAGGVARLGLLGAVAASLCCLTPVVLVMITAGLTAIFGPQIFGAASQGELTQRIHNWTDLWYDDHKWAFRIGGLACIGLGLVVFFRRRGVCTLQAARRQRNRIINMTLLTVLLAAGVYWFWNYTILHHWGVWVGLPW